MRGPISHIVDTLAIFATIVGVASTLGFGSVQINSGLSYLFNSPKTFWFQLLILVVATALFIWSAWSEIGRGIKHLSTINMWLATMLVITLFIVGPTIYILNMFTTTIGNYASNFIEMSFNLKPVNLLACLLHAYQKEEQSSNLSQVYYLPQHLLISFSFRFLERLH